MSGERKEITLNHVEPYVWEIPKSGEMLVPGRIYGDEALIEHLLEDIRAGKEWNALKQVVNVACLPGIQKASLAMADVHPGYGFPIGGVGAFDMETGVVSVAGVGFDINCGVRVMATPLTLADLEPKKEQLAEELFRVIPAGVGSEGSLRLSDKEVDQMLVKGARFCLERGLALEDDLAYMEEEGCVAGADPNTVSRRAKEREHGQVGTLGSGNHYLEVQRVTEIYDAEAARAYGLRVDQILVAIHCGSRALGHQIGTDYLKTLEQASRKYSIPIRDKELVCAPITSSEGRRYLAAHNCGVNCAFANRQALAHLTRQALVKVFGLAPEQVRTLYEVGHNNAKVEWHTVDGERKKLLVHRKGATRAFGPGREELPPDYRAAGQPVLVGGTMGTASYVLRGTEKGMAETFGSAIHGAGRLMSREQAKRQWRGTELVKKLGAEGILIKSRFMAGVAEEAPGAYKDVIEVADVMHNAGVNLKVAMAKPLICVKG
jgi:tRNA-splicing ligase RtcB